MESDRARRARRRLRRGSRSARSRALRHRRSRSATSSTSARPTEPSTVPGEHDIGVQGAVGLAVGDDALAGRGGVGPAADHRDNMLERSARSATYCFIASRGCTQGPPLSLHPGEPAIAISKPYLSPKVTAYRKASFHSGVIKPTGWGRSSGVNNEPSNAWKPPSPTRCIHSRSSWIPSFETLLPIQCHQTRGRAPRGFQTCLQGCSRPRRRHRRTQSQTRTIWLVLRTGLQSDFIPIIIGALPCSVSK